MAAGIVRAWMRIAFAIALVCGMGGGAWYLKNRANIGRPMPQLDIRFDAVNRRLTKPVLVSPTEEYPGPDGEILYLTSDQFRAVNLASALPIPGYDRRLAAIFVEGDPDRQAAMVQELFDSVPATQNGDETAVGIFRLGDGLLASPPPTPLREKVSETMRDKMACRFESGSGGIGWQLPSCSRRASMVPAYVLGGVSGAILLVVGIALSISFFGRRKRPASANPIASA